MMRCGACLDADQTRGKLLKIRKNVLRLQLRNRLHKMMHKIAGRASPGPNKSATMCWPRVADKAAQYVAEQAHAAEQAADDYTSSCVDAWTRKTDFAMSSLPTYRRDCPLMLLQLSTFHDDDGQQE